MPDRQTRKRIRIVEFDKAELYCYGCHEWYALTAEFWVPTHLDRCRACGNERSKLHQALRRHDPAFRLMEINKGRRYRAYIARTEPVLLEAYDRERRLTKNVAQKVRREAERANAKRTRNREWMRQKRARVA